MSALIQFADSSRTSREVREVPREATYAAQHTSQSVISCVIVCASIGHDAPARIMAGKIFINYRRDDSISTAGRLQDRLALTFGRKNLFMDVDHVPAGVDFVEYLHGQVAKCDV